MELFLIELHVGDWPVAVAWYRSVLALPLAMEDAGGRFALLGDGPTRLALKEGPPGVGARLVFRVDDLEAERARLEGLGVAVAGPFANDREGYREVRLADPQGTPITLFAWERR